MVLGYFSALLYPFEYKAPRCQERSRQYQKTLRDEFCLNCIKVLKLKYILNIQSINCSFILNINAQKDYVFTEFNFIFFFKINTVFFERLINKIAPNLNRINTNQNCQPIIPVILIATHTQTNQYTTQPTFFDIHIV